MRVIIIALAIIVAGCAGPSVDETEPIASENEAPGEENQTFEPVGVTEECNSLRPVLPTTASPDGLAGGWDAWQIDVIMLADPYFVEEHPEDWAQLLQDMVDDASTQYQDQLSIRLNATVIDELPAESLTDSADADTIWSTARGFVQTFHADVQHDYVAVILGADYNGGVAGQVECVTGGYTTDTAYLWAEYTRNRTSRDITEDVGVLLDMPLKVFMHETGHLLGAHHHYTNCIESSLQYSGNDAAAACGVMINDIGLAGFQFSSLNRLVMRSWVEEAEIGHPVATDGLALPVVG